MFSFEIFPIYTFIFLAFMVISKRLFSYLFSRDNKFVSFLFSMKKASDSLISEVYDADERKSR